MDKGMQRESIDQSIDCDRAEMDSMLASVDALVKDALEDALQESNAAAPSTMPIVILQYSQNGGWFRYAFSKDPEFKEKQAEKDSDL